MGTTLGALPRILKASSILPWVGVIRTQRQRAGAAALARASRLAKVTGHSKGKLRRRLSGNE
jgi:hypothetical protein